MRPKLSDTSISNFWKWFSRNCQDFDNKSLLGELEKRLRKLGNFAWEIGPGQVEENAFVISPGGDLGLLQYTKEIVSKAMPCRGWEFHYAKPPKQWDLKFFIQSDDCSKVYIDACEWEYVLLQFDDGTFDIILKAHSLNEHDRLIAGQILLDGILGEEKRMKFIHEIEFVNEFEAAHAGKQSNIAMLAKHLTTLCHP